MCSYPDYEQKGEGCIDEYMLSHSGKQGSPLPETGLPDPLLQFET